MLAFRLHPGGTLRLHEEPVPEPGPGEVLVRVAAVGLCGSDRHWVLEGGIGDAALRTPLVLGHEFAGIAETGAYRGRLVAVDPAIPCGECDTCRRGATHLCPRVRFAGYGQQDGGLRDVVAWPEAELVPLAESVNAVEAALVEPLAVAIHGLDVAGEVEGARVAVLGCGPIGLLVIALARAAGAACVVATDPLPNRAQAAAGFGATTVVGASGSGEEAAAILAAVGEQGADVVFEAAGEQPAVDTAVDVARPGGRIVLVGIPGDDRTSFSASRARRKELTIHLSRRSTPATFRRAAGLVEARTLSFGGLVTLRVPLERAADAFAALVARSESKVIVEPGTAA